MLTFLLAASFLAGSLVPIIAATFLRSKLEWARKLASPTWDFTKSWASNLTAAGTILSYAAMLSCFSPTANLHFVPRAAYLSVGTIAGGLTILAPLAFNFISRILQALGSKSSNASAFLLAAGITIWGLTLQLFLGSCLLWELRLANILPTVPASLFICLLILCSASVVAYAVLTAEDTLKKEAPETPNMGEVMRTTGLPRLAIKALPAEDSLNKETTETPITSERMTTEVPPPPAVKSWTLL